MLRTFEKNAAEQLRVLAQLHQGGKPTRAEQYRALTDDLEAGKIESLIFYFRAVLIRHEPGLRAPLTETEQRMGASAARLEHMDETQEATAVLEALAAVHGNEVIWGPALDSREFKQNRRLIDLVDDLTADSELNGHSLPANTTPAEWQDAMHEVLRSHPDTLLALIQAHCPENYEVQNILLARIVDRKKRRPAGGN